MENFDQVFDRLGSNCVKWDSIETTYGKKDLIPLWVADMDFMAPTPVKEALAAFVEQGIYGYTVFPESLYEAICKWELEEHHFELKKEEILFSPGVVPSIALAIQAYTEIGDAVLINDPVYPPFAGMVKNNQRKLVRSPLQEKENHFVMDLADMETKIIENNVKLFLLCNPHNPGGRVWHKEELQSVAELCHKHDVLLVSDEIHQDLVFPPYEHISLQTIDPNYADFSIILTAPTKTFNLAGIKNSMVFIKNPQLRKQFVKVQAQSEQDTLNTFGMVATQAAYNEGKPWLNDLLRYLQKNVDFACQFFQEHLPKIGVLKPEGTYLLWLDFSAYDLSDKALQDKLINEAGVVLNPGISFGPSGSKHMRLNVACPQEILKEGLQRIAKVF